MAPRKRKAAAPATSSKPTTTPTTRRSKLAKDYDISAEEEAEIKSAWSLFKLDDTEGYEDEKEGVIETRDVQKALVKQDLDEFVEILDPEGEGYVTYAHFVELCALQLKNKSAETRDEEVEEAFALFTQGTTGTAITLQHLRSVARLLKEDVGDDVLKAMILEANGGQAAATGVDIQHFRQVMVRAGVFQ
ncbi:hypothetical protein DV735_g2400, partial [Chaetothyriales sp. CBS 134920]